MKNLRRGYTMVELIIVIVTALTAIAAVLGAVLVLKILWNFAFPS